MPAKASELEKVARKLGFEKVRQKGSHARWKHADGRSRVKECRKISSLHSNTVSATVIDHLSLISFARGSLDHYNRG